MKTLFNKELRRDPQLSFWVGAIAGALVLYLLHFTFLIVPVLVLAMAYLLPFPGIFRSLFSRVVVSLLFFYSLFQLAANLQFFLFPKSHFSLLASLCSLLVLLVIAGGSRLRAREPIVVFDRKDLGALSACLFFVVPLLVMLGGGSNLTTATRLGGIQGVDAVNHFASFAELNVDQRFTYIPGNYYPNGFHLTTAFIQSSEHISQANRSWSFNVRQYFAQYMVWGSVLMFVLFYLCRILADAIALKRQQPQRLNNLMIALGIGPALTLFYLLPFVYHGFLHFYYISADVACALIYIYELGVLGIAGARARWITLGYLLLVFGAGASWQLLIPPLLLIPILYLLPDQIKKTGFLKGALTVRNTPIFIGFLIQLIPLYLQLKYTSYGGDQGINQTGGLRLFHYGLLAAGLIFIIYLSTSANLAGSFKKFVNNTFQSFYILLAGLMFIQYIVVGELRYYAIKSAFLVEMLLIVLLVAWLVYQYGHSGLGRLKYLLMMPIIPSLAIALLIGINSNDPLQNTRDLLRIYSHKQITNFFNEDTKIYVRLGTQGEIKHLNTTLLHYDQGKQKLYAHMPIANWANIMSYGAQPPDFGAWRCGKALYENLAFGTFSDKDQADLISKVKDCAQLAKQNHQQYLIVTDLQSAPYLSNLFQDNVRLVY